MIDLMLQLPLRDFQARIMDSGEGDSSAVENLVGAPSMTANASPYVIPNREKACSICSTIHSGHCSGNMRDQ